jgi:hypothetical protein
MAGERVDNGPEQPDRMNAASQSSLQVGFRRHHFGGRWIDLPLELTEVQLDGRACVRCGAEDQRMRPVEAWSELSSQLFECIDVEACADRRGVCGACGHEWRWHTRGGMCQGTADGVECHCVMMRPAM